MLSTLETHEKPSNERFQLLEYPQTLPINSRFDPRAAIFAVVVVVIIFKDQNHFLPQPLRNGQNRLHSSAEFCPQVIQLRCAEYVLSLRRV